MKKENMTKVQYLAFIFLFKIATVLAFLGLTIMLLDMLLSNVSIVTRILTATAFSVSLITLAFLVIGVGAAAKYCLDASKKFIKSLNGNALEENIKNRIASTAQRMGLIGLVGIKTEKIPNAMAFGLTSKRPFIIFSPSFLRKLDDEELDCVILHEVFHIKHDVESRSFNVIFRKLNDYPINMNAPFVILLICLIPLCIGIQIGYVQLGPISALTYSILSAIAISAGAIGAIIGVVLVASLMKDGVMPRKQFYLKELIADAYSAIITRKPMKLYSAIVKGTIEKPLDKDKYLNKVSFADHEHTTPPKKSLKFADIYHISLSKDLIEDFKLIPSGYPSCPVEYRLKSLVLIDQLINNNVRINIMKKENELSLPVLMKLPSSISSSLRENKEIFKKVMEYIMQNSDRFNIIECANQLQIDPIDVFASLVAASNQGILDIQEN